MHAGRPRTAGKHSSRSHHVPTPDKISGCGCSTRTLKRSNGNGRPRPSTVFSTRVFGALAIQSHHRKAAGRGDSGGPVFVQGKGGVKAVGIISATESTRDKAPCTGVDLHRGCFWSLELPLMTGTATSIEAELNVKVNT